MDGLATMAQEMQRPEAFQVLLEASAILLTAADHGTVLSGLLDLASKVMAADGYAVWCESDDQATWRAIATRGLSPEYRTLVRVTPENAPRTMWAIEDLQNDPSVAQHRAVHAAEGLRSLLVAPLALQGGAGATLTLYWRSKRTFSKLEKDYAAALANLAAAALNTNHLREQNQREKQRLAFLAEASTILASSLDYEITLNRVAQLAVPHIADWCTVHIVEDGTVNRLVVAHADPEMLVMAEDYSARYPEEMHEDRGLGAVLRTGKSEIYPRITDEMLALAAQDPEQLAMLRELRLTSSILVPLASRGTVLGAIRLLAAGGERYFTDDDVQLAEDLGRRAATAIENAQLHRAVLKQASELRLAHSAAKMGSWSWDLEKNQQYYSPEFKALHKLAPDDECGPGLIHPDDRARVTSDWEEALASDAEQIQWEHRAVTPDGRTLWLQTRGSIHRNASGEAASVFCITMDVTDSRQAEHALRRTEKLAAAGRLAATVAHEVNNPLEALTNLIYLASATDELPPQAKGYLKSATLELSRMTHVVQQTLGFYRESVDPKPTDLGAIVAEALDLYRSRAHTRSVELSEDHEPDLCASANAGEIRQVVANLISNAIDACAPGGSVCTSVRRSGESIEIVVADSGAGISQAHLGRVFEPFFTTKADVGTGLGLWVSKGIVEKHHGSIQIVSQSEPPRTGTKVTVSLPALPV